MIAVNREEAKRYMGFWGVTESDEKIEGILDRVMQEMRERVDPREVHKRLPLEWNEDRSVLSFGGITVASGGLLKNLTGCGEVVMLAVTLGPEPDRMLRRAEIRGMLETSVCQAVGAAMAEAWCEEVNERIRREAAAENLFTRPRYSPGYGGFPLSVQKDFERVLQMPRTIGVSLSESLLMTPTKSITAVVGLSGERSDCHRAGCELCNMAETCQYSRLPAKS